jgi:hypothetical protein
MEFNYKHNLIKSLLNKIKDIDLKCQIIEVDEIKSFVSNKIKPPVINQKPLLTYKERSSGKFDNLASSDELKELFEKIKETIQNSS